MNKFSINSYISLMNTDGKFWVIGDEKMYQLINFLINIGMVLNRWIYQLVDLSLQIFMSNTVFEDTIGSVFKVAVNLYSALFSSLGTTLFIFALVSIVVVFAFSSPQEAFRKIVVLFMVIGVNFVIYSKGDEYLTDVNDIFEEVETVMTSAISLPMFDDSGNQKELNVGAESSVDVIRKTYFKLSMQQAFAMVNFGTPEYKKEFDEFLYTMDQENDDKAKKGIEDKVKEESEENRYLTPDGALDKIFISTYAVVSNLFVGIPLLLIAVMKFLLKILILCMVFGLPILSLLSLIPKFSNSIFNGIGKIMMVFFIGIFLSVAMYLFFFVMALIDSSVIALASVAGGATLVSCVLAAVVKGITVYLIVKFRNQIVSFVTGGRVTNVNAMDKRLLRAMKNTGGNGNDSSISVDSAEALTIGQAEIEIANALINGDFSNGSENDNIVDSRDYAEDEPNDEVENADIEIENADIEAENLGEEDFSKTNENRADINSDIEDDQEEKSDIGRIELDSDIENDQIDSTEILPADLEKLEVEELENVEIENLDSLENSETPDNEFGDSDSLELNNQLIHELNDYSALEEPPEVNREEYYQELEKLRNE